MALKRQFDMSATFSMASMTDIIFLLLIFFMVTSTFVFPNALEVSLPESAAQTALKPSARIYLDTDGRTASMYGEGADWQMIENDEQLGMFFLTVNQQNTDSVPSYIGLYADKEVPYGRVVEILNLGSEKGVKVVLATSAPANSPTPAPAPLTPGNE